MLAYQNQAAEAEARAHPYTQSRQQWFKFRTPPEAAVEPLWNVV